MTLGISKNWRNQTMTIFFIMVPDGKTLKVALGGDNVFKRGDILDVFGNTYTVIEIKERGNSKFVYLE